MSTLKKIVAAQKPLIAEFTFNFDDDMLDVNGVSKNFNDVAAPVFDVMDLPINSVVVGGEVVVETAYATSTVATVSVGDSSSATRYGATVDLKTAARTALTLTGFRNSSGLPVRLTFNITVADATAGKATVRVMYVIKDRADERM